MMMSRLGPSAQSVGRHAVTRRSNLGGRLHERDWPENAVFTSVLVDRFAISCGAFAASGLTSWVILWLLSAGTP
jgi:hypothetical protein